LLNTPVVEGVFEGSRALFDLAEMIFNKRSFLDGWPYRWQACQSLCRSPAHGGR
jgi:hypothetical protein